MSETRTDCVAVRAELFEWVSGDELRLLAASCGACGKEWFPRTPQCPYCGGESVQPIVLPPLAQVECSTVVTVAPPNFRGPVPYGFGVVRFASSLQVVAPVLSEVPLAPGTPVQSVPWFVGTNEQGQKLVTYAFRPIEAAHSVGQGRQGGER